MHKKKRLNVLFIGHDMTYVDFYSALSRALDLQFDIQDDHIYFRPGAALYARICYGIKAATPFFCRFRFFKNHSNTHLDTVDLRFYRENAGHNVRKLISLYQSYTSWLSSRIRKKYDLVIVPGEYRLGEQAALKVLGSENSGGILYFEAGPPGYIYFSRFGTNANAHLAGHTEMNREVPIKADLDLQRTETRKQIRLKMILRPFEAILISGSYYLNGPKDLLEYKTAIFSRIQKILKKIYKVKSEKKSNEVSGDEFYAQSILFLGQVKNDVNHTHFGCSNDEIEKYLNDLLSKAPNLRIVWRHHPLEINRIIVENLAKVFKGRVVVSTATSVEDDINDCIGTVCVNSNGGLESLKKGRPVLLLGSSYYQGLEGVYRNQDQFLAEISALGLTKKNISKCVDNWLITHFVPVNYRQGDFRNIGAAAEYITLFLNQTFSQKSGSL